ncbi:MAG: histidine kinase [Caldilineaceae bacterium]
MQTTQPSLKLLLVLTFGGVALLLVTLLSLVIGQISTIQLEADARASLALVANEMSSRLEQEITERYREIELVAATNEALRTPDLSMEKQWALLARLQRIHPDYAWIGIVNAHGTVMIATDNLLVGENVATMPWFQAGLLGPFMGDVREALRLATLLGEQDANNEPFRFIDFAAPILDDDGHVTGVLGAQLNWQWARQLEKSLLEPIAATGDRGKATEIFIVSPSGAPILAPNAWSGQPLDLSGLALEQQGGALVTQWPDGERYVTGYARTEELPDAPGLDWHVLVRQPLAVAYAPAWRTQWLIFGVGALFAILVALATWWLAGRVTSQLVTLTQAAEQIRLGESDAIPVLNGTREVASLSLSLNQLIADLTTATVAERNRIARELHDSVTQTLFSTSMLADVLPKVWESDPTRGKEKLEELRRAVRGALAEMRTLLLELRPSAIADADMQQLMRQLADSTSGRTGVNVTWRIEGDPIIAGDRKVVIYRTMQEAINNLVKHAHADNARVVLRYHEGALELIVVDDGCGFAPEAVTSDHFGLKMMRERVEASGGTLEVVSRPEEGTEIHATWSGRLGR